MVANDPRNMILKGFFLAMAMGLTMACSLTGSSEKADEGSNQVPADSEPEATGLAAPPSSQADQQTADVPSTSAVEPAKWQNNWLHFGVDSQFSSYNPNETQVTSDNVANLEMVHGYGCDDELFSIIGGTPALYHGHIIATYAGGRLELGDPISGDMYWDFGNQAYGWAPPPVVSSDGIIYYLYVTADATAKLYAVDSETGQQIWEAATQFYTGFNFDAQVTVDEKNGLVYIIEGVFGDGRLFAVDRATGEVKWFLGDKQEKEGEVTFAGSIVILDNDKLYIPALMPRQYGKQRHLVRVDPLAQKVDLEYEVPEGMPAGWGTGWYGICSSLVYETFQDSSQREATQLVAHPLDQAGIAWQRTIPPQTGRFACDPRQRILYVPTEESLVAMQAETGEVLWEKKSIEGVFTPTIANGLIYYISDTNMYVLDQENGEQLFRYGLGVRADPSTGVVVNDGLVIFSGSGGDCDLIVLRSK